MPHDARPTGRFRLTMSSRRAAKTDGADVIAVTDHDTVDGVEVPRSGRGRARCARRPGDRAVGSARGPQRAHARVLLRSDARSSSKLGALECGESRIERAKGIVAKLNELGYAITLDDVRAQAGGTDRRASAYRARARRTGTHRLGAARVHARAHRGRGPSGRLEGALTAVEAIGVIRAAGGVAVIAHPGVGHHEGEARAVPVDMIEELLRDRVDGHRGRSPRPSAAAARRARRDGRTAAG